MLLTAPQVIAIELAILIIYFCFKETRRVNVTKENKERVKLSDHKNQEVRLPKQKKKEKPKAKVWTEGRKRKNKPKSYHFKTKGFKNKTKKLPF